MASRVLIVDDDEGTRAGLAQLLEQAGYEATTVGRFQDALRIVRTNPPDLLITDVRLEAYNGLQLVLSSPHHVPAIVITGFADPVLETEARRRGAEYLLKPVSPGMLLTLVEEKLAAAKAGFPLPRRWPRKQIVGGLPAEVAGVEARIVDVSYGGMRLEIERPPEHGAGGPLTISLPEIPLTLRADLVWSNFLREQTWLWGASMGSEAASPEWRRVVDAVP